MSVDNHCHSDRSHESRLSPADNASAGRSLAGDVYDPRSLTSLKSDNCAAASVNNILPAISFEDSSRGGDQSQTLRGGDQSVTVSPNITDTNTFNPTNTNTFNPTIDIHIEQPAAPASPGDSGALNQLTTEVGQIAAEVGHLATEMGQMMNLMMLENMTRPPATANPYLSSWFGNPGEYLSLGQPNMNILPGSNFGGSGGWLNALDPFGAFTSGDNNSLPTVPNPLDLLGGGDAISLPKVPDPLGILPGENSNNRNILDPGGLGSLLGGLF